MEPAEGSQLLEDLAADLIARNSNLNAQVPQKLAASIGSRWNNLDGCGNLTARRLREFCKSVLEVCIDQVDFMRSLLEPNQLLARIKLYVKE